MYKADVGIIGGGILGLATGYEITQRYPTLKVVVLEKEAAVAQHQSGHNSGVLHSGIYYKPGTLKAENCRAGKLAMQQFCDAHEIPYELCGKVIVASDDSEVERLHNIYQRGQANGVECRIIDKAELHDLEPHAAGVQAIHVPETGIVDYTQVCRKLADLICGRDGRILFNAHVKEIVCKPDSIVLQSAAGDLECKYLVNCAGLYSDRVAKLAGVPLDLKVVPFRGEFYELQATAEHLCRTLIYPVPDPAFPFLGVHFTRVMGGGVECGPNAVLALSREGYHKYNVRLRDLLETSLFPGFDRLALKYWKTGLGEMWRSVSKAAFVASLQKLIPEIRGGDIRPAPAGVRAQAVNRQGELVDDFLFRSGERMVHVINAPSPAATSSLNIARLVVDRLQQQF